MKAQEYLDQNYPKENRSKISEIHLNEQLSGDLDLSDFTYYSDYWKSGITVYISSTVDSNQVKIKNLSKKGKVIELAAQKWLDQNYPKNGVCQRETKDKNWGGEGGWNNLGKTRSEITKLDISKQNLEGDLDLSGFVNCKKLYCHDNKLTALNLSNCPQLEEFHCSRNQLTNLTLPTNPINLKKISLDDNNFANQDLSFLVPVANLEWLNLSNTYLTGSLDYLSGMKYLKIIWISHTDINEVNIDKLPRSLRYIVYSTKNRPNCQLTKIIPQLEKHFGKFGRCLKCWLANTSEKWCQPCQEKEWQADLNQLTGQELVEKFIQQQKERDEYSGLQWIPYEQFTNIEYLAEGGFGKIYKVEWGKYESGNNRIIVLKSLTNSQSITLEFLQEIVNTKLVGGKIDSNIVPCHGISQDPKTGNYVMVMRYEKEGNLQQFLKKYFVELTWEDKIKKLKDIIDGLKNIHDQNLVHRDFHSGNILNDKNKYYWTYITDLGLSWLANSQKKEGEIFGVMPYVAPEVLQGEKYTQASDIYSFGIIMYEMLTGLPPYYNIPHNETLAIKICQGLRPQFKIKIPPLLDNLIKRCWHADPKQRPSAEELGGFKGIFGDWYKEIKDKQTTPFTQQIQETDKFNLCQPLTKLYQQYRGQVKEIKPEEVEKTKKELFTEFCQKNNYDRETYEAEKEFRKLLFPNPNYELHSGAVYHSKAINTQQITQQLATLNISRQLGQDSTQIDLVIPEEIADPQEQSSTQAQIQIPPKNGK